MQLFLDTANMNDIRNGIAVGCIRGVTTNPTIISREGRSLKVCIEEIVQLDPELTVLIEVVSVDTAGQVAEARELIKLAPNAVIKIPMTGNGLAAVRLLSAEGIPTAVTLVFSVNQAIAAVCAGANYIAPFVGRLDDIGADGLSLVRSIKNVLNQHDSDVQIISASVRSPQAVADLFAAGSDIVTIPFSVLEKMLLHPLTDAGLLKFEEDWKSVPQQVATG